MTILIPQFCNKKKLVQRKAIPSASALQVTDKPAFSFVIGANCKHSPFTHSPIDNAPTIDTRDFSHKVYCTVYSRDFPAAVAVSISSPAVDGLRPYGRPARLLSAPLSPRSATRRHDRFTTTTRRHSTTIYTPRRCFRLQSDRPNNASNNQNL